MVSEKELLQLRIKALNAVGEALKAVKNVYEALKEKGDIEGLECLKENVEKMEELYEACVDCCLDGISKYK